MPQTPHVEQHFTASDVVRDVVIGMSDGLTVPFALAAGLSGAVESSGIIVTAGLAEVAAGAIAMGLFCVAMLFFGTGLRRSLRSAEGGESTYSSVAYAGRVPVTAPPSDVAPLASLIDRLGPAAAAWKDPELDQQLVVRWVFGVLSAALLLEWASRRIRGVK